MSEFGPYQSQRQVHRGPFGSVYVARTAGDKADRYVVKTCDAAPWLDDAPRAESRINDLVDAAETQRRAAEAAGPRGHWAGIHDIQRTDEGAYFVTDYYAASARGLSGAGAVVGPGALHHVVTGVCEGLLELKRACARPHGRLKPPNILLSSLNRLERAKVALTDLLPSSQLDEQVTEAADLRQVGELIHQLVTGRAWSPQMGLPEQPDEPWQRLGKQAAGWHRLCADLLEAEAPPTLEQVSERLNALKPDRRRAWIISGSAAAAVLLAATIAIVLAALTGPAEPEEDHPAGIVDRPQLEREIRNWFASLYHDLRQDPDRFTADDHLRSHLVEPIRQLEEDDVLIHDVRDVPGGNDRQVQRSTELMQQIRRSLTTDRWPARKRMVEKADRLLEVATVYEQRTWEGPAAYLRQLAAEVESLREAAGDASNDEAARKAAALHRIVDQTLRLDRASALRETLGTVERIDEHYERIAEHRRRIEDKDPVLGQFGDWIAGMTALPAHRHEYRDMLELRRFLRDAEALGRRLAGFVEQSWDRVDVDALPGDGLVEADPAMAETFNTWLEQIEDYFRLDPHPRKQYEDAIEDRYERIRQLIAELEGDDNIPDAAADAERFRDRLKELQSSLEQGEAELVAIARHRDRFVELYRDHRDELDVLHGDVQAHLAPDPEAIAEARRWLDEWRQRRVDDAPDALNEAFSAYRDARAAEYELSDLVEGRMRRGELEAELTSLFEALEALDLGHPPAPQMPDALDDRPWARRLLDEQAFLTGFDERLHRRLEAVADEVRQADRPDGDRLVESVEDVVGTVREQMMQRGEQLQQIAARAGAIEDRLDHWYALDEDVDEPFDPSSPSIDGLMLRIDEIPVSQDRAVVETLEPIDRRIEKLQDVIAASGRRLELREKAIDAALPIEARFLAWEQLGRVAGQRWPDDIDELKQEAELHQVFVEGLGNIPNEARRQTLAARLETEGRDRWLALMRRLDDADDLAAATALRRNVGVREDEAIAHPRTKFNVMLTELREDVGAAEGDEDRIRASIEDFRERVTAMEQRPAGISGWLDDLDGALDEAQHGIGDLAAAGPAAPAVPERLRWQLNHEDEDGEWAEYTWRGHTLRFARVDHEDGPPTYLATVETSVGLAVEILDQFMGDPGRRDGRQRRAWEQFAEFLPDEEQRRGPATWRYHSDEQAIMRLSRRPRETDYGDVWFLGRIPHNWDPRSLRQQGLAFYDMDGLNRAANPTRPGSDHPFQQFQPPAAVYLAHLLGCRLPTSDDWQKALDAEPPRIRRGEGGNLRDQAFRQQDEHLRRVLPEAAIIGPRRPRADGGSFQPAEDPGDEARFPPPHYNDGVIWFRPVHEGAGEVFKNLMGNVAELVHDEPERFLLADVDDVEAEAEPRSPGGIADELLRQPRNMAIAGASALSFHNEVPLRPKQLDSDDLGQVYSDVGFRFAFTSPGDPLPRRVQRILEAPFDGKPLLLAGAHGD